MEAKGTALVSIPLFIHERFGENAFTKWLEALTPEARTIYKQPIVATGWYPLKKIFSEPTQKLCEVFYGGDLKGAWECGRFSADYGLKGIYKVFVKIGSSSFLVNKAGTILPTYYKPSKMEVIENEKDHMCIRAIEFPEIDSFIEHRIAGWIERALEISGCRNVQVEIPESLTRGSQYTEFKAKWL